MCAFGNGNMEETGVCLWKDRPHPRNDGPRHHACREVGVRADSFPCALRPSRRGGGLHSKEAMNRGGDILVTASASCCAG